MRDALIAALAGALAGVAFLIGTHFASHETKAIDPPSADRAYADMRVWTGDRAKSIDTKVTYLRRNAVVVNWTVGYGRQLRVQARQWYARQSDGSFKLIDIQYLSGLGG